MFASSNKKDTNKHGFIIEKKCFTYFTYSV